MWTPGFAYDSSAEAWHGDIKVEHEYFYAVHGADDAMSHGYLEKAYTLGREF